MARTSESAALTDAVTTDHSTFTGRGGAGNRLRLHEPIAASMSAQNRSMAKCSA
jgi:hypothetical protein